MPQRRFARRLDWKLPIQWPLRRKKLQRQRYSQISVSLFAQHFGSIFNVGTAWVPRMGMPFCSDTGISMTIRRDTNVIPTDQNLFREYLY